MCAGLRSANFQNVAKLRATSILRDQIGPFTHVTKFVDLSFVYGKKSFLSKESDTKILQSIYFAYDVGIISSYSNMWRTSANHGHSD